MRRVVARGARDFPLAGFLRSRFLLLYVDTYILYQNGLRRCFGSIAMEGYLALRLLADLFQRSVDDSPGGV